MDLARPKGQVDLDEQEAVITACLMLLVWST